MDTTDTHVLVGGDDLDLCNQLREYLGRNDFQVTAANTAKQVLELVSREAIDVLLLETRLNGADGLQLTQKVRESASLPIVVLSGRSEEADRVMGLELGADDYVTRPFSLRELLARIRAVLRRSRLPAARDDSLRAYRFEGWELNLRLFRLKSPDGSCIDVSRGEFALLRAFLSAPQRILSRERLLELTHINSLEVYDRSIDVQIMRLRRKIEVDCAHPRFIRTERGAGYYFDASVIAVR